MGEKLKANSNKKSLIEGLNEVFIPNKRSWIEEGLNGALLSQ